MSQLPDPEWCGRMNGGVSKDVGLEEGLLGPYANLTVVNLRQELKRRGLSHKGVKRQLIARLTQADHTMRESNAVRERKKQDVCATNGTPLQTVGDQLLGTTDKMSITKDRQSLVIWRRPLMTLYYFVLELGMLAQAFMLKLWRSKLAVLLGMVTFLTALTIYHLDGPHQSMVLFLRKELLWCGYWLGLGILSSVGLGTGLHTFLLYLGPHIAAVTLAAFECMSVDFPEPPYPDDIICPDVEGTSMSLWAIISKVRLEAFMWGAGTAIGELPPYFMARAARLSGQIDEEEQEIEELIHEKEIHPKDLSVLDRGKIAVHDLVQRVGFIGILLCASIPNPLFDLAGITCGHFLIPFWTFFGATLLGKAVIKMHIQKLFVIFTFSEKHIEQVIFLIRKIPHFGPSLQAPFEEYLQKQKEKLHHRPGTEIAQKTSWLSWIFEKIVMVMVVYFVISIINSMAQSYHKRLTQARADATAAVLANRPKPQPTKYKD